MMRLVVVWLDLGAFLCLAEEVDAMTANLKELEEQAMRLPLRQRAELAERLISSLDRLDEGECERLWVAEAARRYEEYKKGNLSARPAEDVFRDARARMR